MTPNSKKSLISSLTGYFFGRDEEQKGSEFVLLESQQQGHPSSTQTFIAAQPKQKLYAYGDRITWVEGDVKREFVMNPWEALNEFRQTAGWAFGLLGYDLKNFVEPLKSSNQTPIRQPDLFMMEPGLLLKITDGKVEEITGKMPTDLDTPEMGSFSIKNIKTGISRAEFIETVQRIQHQIQEGDFYELNFSYPVLADFEGSPFALYNRMREVNPVPFGAYLSLDGLQVCCSSPERFLQKKGRKIISEPIKGTSARSEDADKDRRLKDDLMSEKNRAENLMIVDLVRHDFSRIAKTGSVEVSKLYDIQTFDTVHQLISRVEAEHKDGVTPTDIIKACFPMGSMTGAPKYRVMKEIDRHEKYRRGIYSGAIGYFTPEGDFDFNVVIRTALVEGGKLVYPVGGAITSDSDPAAEWEETDVKTRTLSLAAKPRPAEMK